MNCPSIFQQRYWRDRVIPSHADRDSSIYCTDLDDDKAAVKLHKEQKRRIEKESRDRRNRDQDDREPSHENNRDFNLQRLPERRKSSRKVEGFGADPILASCDDKDALKSEFMMLLDYFYSYLCLFGMLLCYL